MRLVPQPGYDSGLAGWEICGINKSLRLFRLRKAVLDMKSSHDSLTVLLLGTRLRSNPELIKSLSGFQIEIIFADEAAKALQIMSTMRPSLVVIDASFRDATSADFTLAIRGSGLLAKIPILFAEGNYLAEMLGFFEREAAELQRRRELADLKARHLQTLAIIRETADLFHSLVENDTPLAELPDELAEERIEFGMNMIRSLAGVLDEEIRTIEEWFGPNFRAPVESVIDGDLQELDMALPM